MHTIYAEVPLITPRGKFDPIDRLYYPGGFDIGRFSPVRFDIHDDTQRRIAVALASVPELRPSQDEIKSRTKPGETRIDLDGQITHVEIPKSVALPEDIYARVILNHGSYSKERTQRRNPHYGIVEIVELTGEGQAQRPRLIVDNRIMWDYDRGVSFTPRFLHEAALGSRFSVNEVVLSEHLPKLEEALKSTHTPEQVTSKGIEGE